MVWVRDALLRVAAQGQALDHAPQMVGEVCDWKVIRDPGMVSDPGTVEEWKLS